MPDSSEHSPTIPPLDPVADVLEHVGRLGYAMQHDGRGDVEPMSNQPRLKRLTYCLVGLQDFLERPPAGYEQVADVLRRVGRLVRACRQLEWWDARDHYPDFNSLYQTGMEVLAEARNGSRANDPLAFLDAPVIAPSAPTPTPVAATAEELATNSPPGIQVDLQRNRIVIDGTEFLTTGETARMAQLLLDQQGEWVAMSKHGFTKPSEVKRRLPAPLLDRVEAEKGKGYRLR